MNNFLNNNYFKLFIKYLLLAIICIMIGKYFINNLDDLKNYKFSINNFSFIYSIFCLWIWMLINSYIYNLLIKRIDPSSKIFENFLIWSNSFLGRYIPGKVGILFSRIYFHQKNGINPKKVSFVFLLEIVLSVLSALIVFASSSLFYEFSYVMNYRIISLIIILSLMIIIHPQLMSYLIVKISKIFQKEQDIIILPLNYLFYLNIIFLNIVKWFFIGIGVYLLANSITTISLTYFPLILGTYALASVVGLIAFFAPSGIGVTEGIIVFSLKYIIPGGLAVIISILIRLWKIFSEVSFIIIVNIFIRVFSKNNLLTQKYIRRTN